MAKELPYLSSYKNVGTLFKKIESAKVPEVFNQKYLYDTLGLKSVSDRSLISLLKSMGLVEQSGQPTIEYSKLKNNLLAGGVIADGIKRAYAPLFDSDENAHVLTLPELKGLISQVSGSDTDTTSKIAGTLNALIKVANFSMVNKKSKIPLEEDVHDDDDDEIIDKNKDGKNQKQKRLHPEFHYNIQIHLPTNATEETYLNIFNAIRKSFQ